MKDFLKIMLASALGFILANIVFLIISMIIFFGMMGSVMSGFQKQEFKLSDNSVLNLRLEGTVKERVGEDNDLLALLGDNRMTAMGLDDITSAIRKAKDNDKVKGIYIDSRMFTASAASLQEIRNELLQFKESGKFVVSYADTYTQGGYYLASVADKVAINPQGMLDLHGLSATPMFYKNMLDKLGIKMQIFKVGTYKSAVEPFMLTEMSDANREQVSAYLNDMWKFIKTDIAQSRNITNADIDLLANQMPLMKESSFLTKSRLVDTLVYESEMKDYLRTLIGIDIDDKIPSASVADMESVKRKSKSSKNEIALLYAVGEITSGTGTENIQDKRLVHQIEKLKDDENIKAVVLRVNSPGGSAYASEQIWKAVSELKKEKPVVVSMGDVAASGGYYISCNADKIVAQPTTITGSIGIFGLFPNLEGTTKKIGLNFDVVKTNEYADFGNITRPMNEGERAILQNFIERGYDLFLTRCADGRNIPKDSLNNIAQGRVWTGNQAKAIGLVDELGGIGDAIKISAELAELGDDYVVYQYPKMRSFIEQILDTKKDKLAAKTIKEYLGNSYETFMLIKKLKEQDFVQARLPYDFNIQ